MIEFTKPGMYTSIQDAGRLGLAYYGIPRSGAMDYGALRMANMLVGNAKDSPCFEFTIQGGEIEFGENAIIGMTGADMQWMLNGEEAGRYQTIEVKTGDILKGGYSISGVRGYLAIQGKLDCAHVYNSHSSYAYAKLGNAPIKKGDAFEIKHEGPLNKTFLSLMHFSDYDAALIKCIKGPEYDALAEYSSKQFQDMTFKISAQSNRMGARLECEKLEWKKDFMTKTSCLVPGMIQLPPSGNPIVILQDGQTTGGYPRIALIEEEELWKFNQIRFGKEFKFILSV